jgi:hypothetical protein
MLDHFHKRLQIVERDLDRKIAAPTFPVYDVDNLPDDVVNGQIVIGTDGSINWFADDAWNTKVGGLSTIGDVPQDVVEGQVVIGLDDSLNWFVNGSWYGVQGISANGNPPQDAVNGQIAIGNNSIVWFSNDQWHGFI